MIAASPAAVPALALPHVTERRVAKHLKTLDALYSELAASVRKRAVAAAPALPAAQSAARSHRRRCARHRRQRDAERRRRRAACSTWLPLLLLVAGLALLLAALAATLRMRRAVEEQRLTADAQRKENERNQQAILRLLDELSSLADGDLTVQATVTEDITGAIADSINYAVEALRGLVTTINDSAIQLDGATRQTQALSQHLAKASGAQSKQISSATRVDGGAWQARSRRSRATPSAPRMSRAIRSTSRTRAAMPCAAPSTA